MRGRSSLSLVLIVAAVVVVVGGVLLLRHNAGRPVQGQRRSAQDASRATKMRRTSAGAPERGGAGSRLPAAHRGSVAPGSSGQQVAGGGQGGANAERNCTISGSVIDPTGAPVAGAQVMILSQRDDASTGVVTDASGGFLLLLEIPKDVSLSARFPGLVDSRARSVELSHAGQRVTGIVLALRPPHFLAGKITDTRGVPMGGVIVRAQAWEAGDSGIGEAVSAADGSYRIEGLSDGMHYVGLAHPTLGKHAGGETKVDRTDADFVLGSRDTFIGLVRDYQSKQPVLNIAVQTIQGTGNVSVDAAQPGHFVLTGHTAHTRVRINAPGYADLEPSPITPHPNESVTTRTFLLGPGARIKGKIVDADTSLPTNALVHCGYVWNWSGEQGLGSSQFANDAGEFDFAVPMIDQLVVTVMPEAPYVPAKLRADAVHGRTTDVGIIRLKRMGQIDGLVLLNGTGVAGEKVLAAVQRSPDYKQWDLTTNGMGEFSIPDVPPGTYSVGLTGRRTYQRIAVQSGEHARVVFNLGSAKVSCRVFVGEEPVDFNVELESISHGQTVEAKRNSGEGIFHAGDLSAGKWRIKIWAPGFHKTVEEKFTLQDGEHWHKDFRLPRPLEIRGRVTDAEGTPVNGGTVTITDASNPDALVIPLQIRKNGTYSRQGLEAGTYSLKFFNQAAGSKTIDAFQLSEADSPRELDVVLGKAGGTVTVTAISAETGKPLQGLAVQCYYASYEYTDVNGRAVLRFLPSGPQKLRMRGQCYSIDKVVEVREGETLEFQEELQPVGRAAISIFNPEGDDAAGVTCVLLSEGTVIREYVSDARGTVDVHVPAGTYTLRVNMDGMPSTTIPIVIEKCSNNRLMLRSDKSEWKLITGTVI